MLAYLRESEPFNNVVPDMPVGHGQIDSDGEDSVGPLPTRKRQRRDDKALPKISHTRQILAETDVSSVHLSHASATASTSTSIGSQRKGRLSRIVRSAATGAKGLCASLHSIVLASQVVHRQTLPELHRLALTPCPTALANRGTQNDLCRTWKEQQC